MARDERTLFEEASEEAATHDLRQTATDETPLPEPPVDESTYHSNPFASVSLPEARPPIIITSGERAKARDILTAVRTLRTIERERRIATAEERTRLARFPGFGPVALSIFPDPVTGRYKDAAWRAAGEELKAMLTLEEYDSAKRSTFNAFYTSPTVIAAMHDGLRRLGLPGNATVLEPGCGTGNFMSLGASDLRFIGVELDLISGRIARALHPTQDIRIENFRETCLPECSVEGVIGNVPFADLMLTYRGMKLPLHDYFIAKAVDALKPAGILALVTSHFTLDKQNAALREYVAARADFAGAIRLPSDAFKREGTAVVTDILFLRKRALDDPPNHVDPRWLETASVAIEGVDLPVSRYFVEHPEMVLGTWTRRGTLYGGEGYSVAAYGDLARQLQAAIQRLPTFTPPPLSTTERLPPRLTSLRPERQMTEGSFYVRDDRTICQVIDAQLVPVRYGGTLLTSTGSLIGKRIGRLIDLRDRARRVLQSQNEGWPEEERMEARRQLNDAYDRFVVNFGPINRTTTSATQTRGVIRRMPNLVKFREDPDAMLVMSLEQYDETSGEALKAAIMHRDVVGRNPPITSVGSAEEGLLVSLDQRGRVDLPFIASLYGKLEEQVTAELGDLVFHDPEQQAWQTADAYLSGNVRAKLAAVLVAGPAYERNVERLRQVQPEDVLPGDIDANLGAPWISESDIQAFAANLCGVEPGAIQVGHLPQDAVWSIVAEYAATASVAATSEYGTPRAGGLWLLELALNMKAPVVYDTVRSEGREHRVVNQEATLAAREKQKLLKERFRAWLWEDPERTERLVRLYNDTYNNLRPRLFDGSHLDFAGMNQTVQLRAHQRHAIWRCMTAGNTLLAHAVGAGKTYVMAATGMKMRQAGLIRKPMYVVPNHLLEQFGREFLHLYPNAQLLVAGKDDLARDRRKHLTAKIASGEWDGIIVTHSSFERIGMSQAYQERFLTRQIQEYEQLLCSAAARDANRLQRNLIKTIEKLKAAKVERLQDLLAQDKKDDGLVFDELGVDHVFVDEAQHYKNLETPTKMERVAGIQTAGSERAFDVYMKTQYLHDLHSGHGMTFATGTPVSNTMVELYTMQRFLDPEGLRQRGLEHFDAWAATFGEVIDTMEISPDGASMRPRSRFARFTNLPELQQMFRAFADVQTAEMLELPRPRLETGKPIVIACPMSPQQRELQQTLVERYERLRSQRVDPREDNALSITTDGRKLALDARMLSPNAPDFPESKVHALVERVAAIWRTSAGIRGTQLIFCDMGVQPTDWGYSAYDDILRRLVASGVPREEVALMGEADSDAKKQSLFEKVRTGRVRVLLGSTQKMGTGTNVQKRLAALHHLDAPWKPAEVEQREGRILRQGNENEHVAIYRYVTEGSFDAYMWQALETKARFITQVMTGHNVLRRAEDGGSQELSYAEVKAIASGNPAVLTLAEADAEVGRLTVLQKNHLDEQYLARRNVRRLPAVIAELIDRLTKLTADAAAIEAYAGDPITIGTRVCAREDAPGVLAECLDAMPRHVHEPTRVPLGHYSGLRFGLLLHPQFSPEVFLDGRTVQRSMLSRDHRGPRAVLNAVERLAGGYGAECDRLRHELTIAESQLRDYEARLGKPFPHEVVLSQLTTVRDQLKACLSGTDAELGGRLPDSVAALGVELRAIKAVDTVRSTPERQGASRTAAEEPVTARIRRRLDTLLTLGSDLGGHAA
jgi:N12 class adenine-specific DNA methylase